MPSETIGPFAPPVGSTGAVNASLRPSGLQRGAPAPSGRSVTCSGSPPGTPTTATWPSRRKASRVPSGDQAGAASAGPEVSLRGASPSVPTSHSSSV